MLKGITPMTTIIDNNNGITYERNQKELVWYQEWIYQNGQYIGEIFTNIDEGGYDLRKVKEINISDNGVTTITEVIANFESVCDAKSFVNQAGGL
jgi:hypothetical protein